VRARGARRPVDGDGVQHLAGRPGRAPGSRVASTGSTWFDLNGAGRRAQRSNGRRGRGHPQLRSPCRSSSAAAIRFDGRHRTLDRGRPSAGVDPGDRRGAPIHRSVPRRRQTMARADRGQGVDVRQGQRSRVQGWTQDSDLDAITVAKPLRGTAGRSRAHHHRPSTATGALMGFKTSRAFGGDRRRRQPSRSSRRGGLAHRRRHHPAERPARAGRSPAPCWAPRALQWRHRARPRR